VIALSTKRVFHAKGIPSTTGSETPCGNPGAPSSKAKYEYVTDSELVPQGKGEKNPAKGSETESEIVCLQAVRGLCPVREMPDRVPFA
jgi:hypothetical protein